MSANRSAPATHDFAPSWLRIPQQETPSTVAWQRNNNRLPSNSSASEPAASASSALGSRGPTSIRREPATSKPVGHQNKLLIREPNKNSGSLKEEDFPRLSDDRLASAGNGCQGPWGRSSHQKNIVAGAAEHRCAPDPAESSSLPFGNAPRKVYRAQINKGMVSRRQHGTSSQLNGALLDNQHFDQKTSEPVDIPNGSAAQAHPACGEMHMPRHVMDHSAPLSSSLEKEQRLLREMGWKEDDYENCEISEAECQCLPGLLIKAKAEREKLRMRGLPNLHKLHLESSSSTATNATPVPAVTATAGNGRQISLPGHKEMVAGGVAGSRGSRCATVSSCEGRTGHAYTSDDELVSSSSGDSDTE